MNPKRNLYKVVQTTTTAGGGPNPAYILAADHEDAIEWCRQRLHRHFPEYKFTVQAVVLIAYNYEIGIVEYVDRGDPELDPTHPANHREGERG